MISCRSDQLGVLLAFKHCSYTAWGQGYVHSYKQSEGVLSGTIWFVLQRMVSWPRNICKTEHWNRPLCYSRNKWHPTVRKGCQLIALRCRAVVCVRVSDDKQNIDNAFMRIFFLSGSLFFSLRYYLFHYNTVQSVVYCCEGLWRNV